MATPPGPVTRVPRQEPSSSTADERQGAGHRPRRLAPGCSTAGIGTGAQGRAGLPAAAGRSAAPPARGPARSRCARAGPRAGRALRPSAGGPPRRGRAAQVRLLVELREQGRDRRLAGACRAPRTRRGRGPRPRRGGLPPALERSRRGQRHPATAGAGVQRRVDPAAAGDERLPRRRRDPRASRRRSRPRRARASAPGRRRGSRPRAASAGPRAIRPSTARRAPRPAGRRARRVSVAPSGSASTARRERVARERGIGRRQHLFERPRAARAPARAAWRVAARLVVERARG